MSLECDADTIGFFHDILKDLYKDTPNPITQGSSYNLLDVCAKRPFTYVYNFEPFPHILQKAAVLFESIIRFHPFTDGNKRTALLTIYYFLLWNGYKLVIPNDAAEFALKVAVNQKSRIR